MPRRGRSCRAGVMTSSRSRSTGRTFRLWEGRNNEVVSIDRAVPRGAAVHRCARAGAGDGPDRHRRNPRNRARQFRRRAAGRDRHGDEYAEPDSPGPTRPMATGQLRRCRAFRSAPTPSRRSCRASARRRETGFALAADGRITADFALAIGALTETVTVEAIRGDTVNRTSGEVSRVVDGETVRSLALSGRNYLELASLIPGAVMTRRRPDGGRRPASAPAARSSTATAATATT